MSKIVLIIVALALIGLVGVGNHNAFANNMGPADSGGGGSVDSSGPRTTTTSPNWDSDFSGWGPAMHWHQPVYPPDSLMGQHYHSIWSHSRHWSWNKAHPWHVPDGGWLHPGSDGASAEEMNPFQGFK